MAIPLRWHGTAILRIMLECLGLGRPGVLALSFRPRLGELPQCRFAFGTRLEKGGALAAGPSMVNVLLVIRSALALLGASLSLFNINGWLTVMLGPDCWNYSAKELGVKAVQETTDSVGYKIGVDAATLTAPLAQSLRYAVSGVGVHLAFIGLVVLYLAIVTPHASRLHVQVPFALLLLDLLTLVNATGLIDPNTAGHPRCATVSTSECAGALSTFLPVVILDAAATLLASTGVYPSAKKPKAG